MEPLTSRSIGSLPTQTDTWISGHTTLASHIKRGLVRCSQHTTLASHIKRGLVRCSQHRIDSITSREEDQKSETDRLRRVLRRNGYPTQFVQKASYRRPKDSEKQKPVTTVVIPYTQGLSESGIQHQNSLQSRQISKNHTHKGQGPSSPGTTIQCRIQDPLFLWKSVHREDGQKNGKQDEGA